MFIVLISFTCIEHAVEAYTCYLPSLRFAFEVQSDPEIMGQAIHFHNEKVEQS